MQKLEYYLMPECGYKGEYIKKEGSYIVKEGTVADMLHDSGILWSSDFDYVIPDITALNKLLSEGYYPRLVEWEPITVGEEEYNEIVNQMLSFDCPRPYRTDART